MMIRNGTITYDAFDSSLLTWRTEDPILHTFLVAVLTTIFAYQTTAIFCDVLVGFKPTGEAVITDLGSVLLAQESSILSAAVSVLHNVTLLRWRFPGFKCTCSDEGREQSGINFLVRSKFIVLFLLTPVLSVISVVISLEGDSVVSFRDAHFGGIALGIADDDRIVNGHRNNLDCGKYKVTYARNDKENASFYKCSLAYKLNKRTLNATTLSMSQTFNDEVVLKFASPNQRYGSYFRIDVRIVGEVYRLRGNIPLTKVKSLMRSGQSKMMKGCPMSLNDARRPPPKVTYYGQKWNISQSLPCDPGRKIVLDTFRFIGRLFTVVNSETFEIVSTNELKAGLGSSSDRAKRRSNFVRGDDLPFIIRRRSYVSLAPLSITVACILVCKVVLKNLTNNDIDVGIESIVKDGLGMKCCDSMLQNRSRVDYSGDNFFGDYKS